jgi:hypothetical protein
LVVVGIHELSAWEEIRAVLLRDASDWMDFIERFYIHPHPVHTRAVAIL